MPRRPALRRWRFLLGGLLALALPSGPAAAQESPRAPAARDTTTPRLAPADSAPRSAPVIPPVIPLVVLRRVAPGSAIRVTTPAQGRLAGTLLGADSAALKLRTWDAARHRLPLDGIDTLWVGRSAAPRGAVVGGTAGAVVGAVPGLSIVALFCSRRCAREALELGLTGAALGGLGGGALGALLGAGRLSWRRLHPR